MLFLFSLSLFSHAIKLKQGFSIGLSNGYSTLFIPKLHPSNDMGFATLLDINYEMSNRYFVLYSGLGCSYSMASLSYKIDDKTIAYTYLDKMHTYPVNQKKIYAFNRYQEHYKTFSLYIPVMIGLKLSKNWSVLCGTKIIYPLSFSSSNESDLSITLLDSEVIDPFTHMPTHGLISSHYKGNTSLVSPLQMQISLELAYQLAPLLPAKMASFKWRKKRFGIDYRVALCLDYGLKASDYVANKKAFLQTNPDTKEFNLSSIIEAADTRGTTNVHSFFSGIKCQLFFHALPKKKRRVRKHKRIISNRPIVHPFQVDFHITNAETLGNLQAEIKIHDTSILTQNQVVFTDSISGKAHYTTKNTLLIVEIQKFGYQSVLDSVDLTRTTHLNYALKAISKDTSIVLNHLFFDTNSIMIQSNSLKSLEVLYDLLVENPQIKIQIVGHTDNVGSEKYNIELSAGRARSVYQEIIKRGIDKSRLEWQGLGSKYPIVPNINDANRQINRRVEIKIL